MAFFGYLIVRLYRIQIVDGDEYQQKAAQNQISTTKLDADRGSILSADGKVLASTSVSWKVVFSPHDLREGEAEILAEGIEQILGIPKATTLKQAENKDNYYQVVKTNVGKEDAEAIRQYAKDKGIRYVTLESLPKRIYPYNNMASTLLGFLNSEGKGVYGLEAYYNSELTGTPGRVQSAVNAMGINMPTAYDNSIDAENGNSLILTIDSFIQNTIEKHLSVALTEHEVQNRACVIVQDVNTGAILGMTTMPDYDCNNPSVITDELGLSKLAKLDEDSDEYAELYQYYQSLQWNNKCVNETYEPGSVFKVITTAIALETNAVSTGSTFTCNGSYEAGGVIKHCWKLSGHGTQTLAQAMANSCNPAYMQIGKRIGGSNFYQYVNAFGLTSVTGIDLPAEATGIFHSEASLNSTMGNLETSAFGQSFKVTPVELITAISATVNGGYLYQPYVVQQIQNSDGITVSSHDPVVVRQVVSEETSEKIRSLMTGVVSFGSGINADVPGYLIGGKTGTSEKLDSKSGYYAYSFVGVAPMDDPQVAVLLILDEPYETDLYGSTVAAPVVGSILSEILPYLGVDTNFSNAEKSVTTVKVPNAVGLSAHMGDMAMVKKQLKAEILGNGDKIVAQVPSSSTVLEKGSTVYLYTDKASQGEKVTVPDVIGKTGQVACTMLEARNLNLNAKDELVNSDAVIITGQSIEAGKEVQKGTLITLTYEKREEKSS